MTDLLLSYYGDDLTGSTDAMEALASNGIPTVLFIRPASEAELARFGHCRAVGLAGTSRSEPPAWMDENLTPALAWLKSLDAALCHYKVCSTFDSSPNVGSIGRAIDIGQEVFGARRVPLVVGAPQLRRYTAFGNLFAAFRGETYRIDRHPVMSRHPVTPMDEADIRLHLGKQTTKTVGLVDLGVLAGADVDVEVDRAFEGEHEIVLLDVADLVTQALVGRQLWRLRDRGAPFVVGSSGVEYALVAEWLRTGETRGRATFDSPGPAGRIAVVSGSCSPTTERQIRQAGDDGFDLVAVDPRRFAGPERERAVDAAIAAGLRGLEGGRSVILHTALGPSTDFGTEIDSRPGGRHAIGESLGEILRSLVERQGLTRAVIAGGDTSSHALRQLGVVALTTRLPLPATPGSPLCTAHCEEPAFDGLEIALKGGQLGGDGYFSRIRDGVA
jgi:uncharacterized protein YgbK (DUF1537 family)